MKSPVSLFPAGLACVGVLLLGACEAPQRAPSSQDPCDVVEAPTGPTPTVTIGVDRSTTPWTLTVDPDTAVIAKDTGSIEWVNDTPLEVAVMVQEGPRTPPPGGSQIVLRKPSGAKSGPAAGGIGPAVQPAIALLAPTGASGAEKSARPDPQAVCGEYKYSVVAFPAGTQATNWSAQTPGLELDPPLYLVR